MVCSMFLFIAYKDTVITEGEITNISCTGSWAGLLDYYTIYISKEKKRFIDPLPFHLHLK